MTPVKKPKTLEHAAGERAHAATLFHAAGREIGIEVAVNLDAQYWKRIRSAFLARAEAGDLIDCVVAQEVMLESFAVASYQVVAAAAPGKLGSTFGRIAAEEEEHVAHAIGMSAGWSAPAIPAPSMLAFIACTIRL